MDTISKKITGCFVLFSGLLLTACGGGGGNSQAKSTESDEAIYQVYYQKPIISEGYIPESFEITKYSIKNNEINFTKSRNAPLDERILTEQKVFEINTPQTNIVKRASPTVWTYERLPELKQNLNFELVNLGGENIFDRVLPGYRDNIDFNKMDDRFNKELIAFNQHYKNSVFPNGSICYRLKQTQWNQPYISQISSFSNSLFTLERDRVYSEYDNLSYSLYSNKDDYHLAWGEWHSYDWIFLLNNINIVDTIGVLGNIDNKSAPATFTQAIPWKVDNSLKYERESLKNIEKNTFDSPLAKEIIFNQKLRIASLEKSCFAYNSTAINAVKKLDLINWKQGDSSGIGQFFGMRTWIFEPNS
ncbi:hypothetical protein [Acinetobacter beijerinckii]|uniref:Lipoprotein n=1 Tax=Acinetobacter beijerinckii ANC 3835 TaxID=1217649 RepID=N9E0Y0_9GAMM|nr:hypothetical protein [Acinetobacter beijerinckii]ENW04113.1 hypothetical protein F934_02149 [Acinetobacter beijerinckii ANC 3835]